MNETRLSHARRSVLIAGAAGLFAPGLLKAMPRDYGITGQPAPDLDVSLWLDGEGNPGSFSLTEHRGKFVFLECWQSWCPGCHSHGFPTLQKIYAALKDSDHFVVAAIQTTFEGYASNTPDQLQLMQKRYQLPIAMGHDEGDPVTQSHPTTMRNYRTGGTPWAFLISPDGYVLYNDYGIDGDNAIAYLEAEIKILAS